MIKSLDLRSRRGISGPAGFIIAFPVWYIVVGILLALGFWMWSLSINLIGLSQGGQALAVGKDAETIRRGVLAAGLGGFASEYRDTAGYRFLPRAAIGEVNRTTPVTAFPAPGSFTVQARVLSRIERFYPRAPEAGGWE
jgi:hypothetical protein